MATTKRKKVLHAGLKALIAGAETSAAIKIPAAFISELASLPAGQQEALGAISQDEFNKLLTQTELATLNSAVSAANTVQIKALVQKLIDKVATLASELKHPIFDFDWIKIGNAANECLSKQLRRHSYNATEDVKGQCVKDVLSLWSSNKSILLLSGSSGQGKSWLMYATALTLSLEGKIAVLVEATGDSSKDIQTAADIFWQEIKGHSSTKNLRGIVAALRKSSWETDHWLTLLLDGVQDKTEAQELASLPWEDWGIKVAISCLPEVAEIFAEKSKGRHVKFHTDGFTITELHEYLRRRLGSNWYKIPSDVMNTLHRPLLAKIYCDLAEGKSWHPNNEYELFDKYWGRLNKGISLNSAGLKTLAYSLLHGGSYPWPNDRITRVGLNNEAVKTLVQLGWLQKAPNGCFEIWHDRLLNWAVAESVIAAFQSNEIGSVTLCNQLKELFQSEHAYSGKYLGYVPMDVIWMLVNREILPCNLSTQVVEAIEDTDWHYKDALYSQLLPTIGPRIIPTLFERLERIVAQDDVIMSNQVIDAITSFSHDDVVILASNLLSNELPLAQRAAMKILARRPCQSVLDNLWELHCRMKLNPEPYLREHEHYYSVYDDSFGALKSCVKLCHDWLEKTINRTDSTQPIYDLAYLIANLDDGHDVWLRCKTRLFEKVDPSKERCLATNIYKFSDSSKLDWLLDRIDRNDDLLGASALRALIRINPDKAVEEMVRLSSFELYLSRQSCFSELLIRKPKETYAKILQMMKNSSNVWEIARVFQGNENSVNKKILDYILDALESLLNKELENPSPNNQHPLYLPLSLLSNIYRLHLLECFQNKKGSSLEDKLTSWLLSIGPRFTRGPDRPEQEPAIEILYKIGGSGFTKVGNSWLNADNHYGRFDGLKLAMKRYDQQTIEQLVQVAQQDELWDDFPLEQGMAAFVLAQIGQADAVIKAILRWGLQTDSKVTNWRWEHTPLNDDAMSPAFDVLEPASKVSPGAIMAIGVGRRTDKSNIVRNILQNSSVSSKVALACIITLGRLYDDSPETTELIARHLEIESHRHAARVALLRIMTDNALDRLLDHLEKDYDEWLAVQLLDYEHSFARALHNIQKHLENKSEMYKLQMVSNLSRTARGDKILSTLLRQTKFQDVVRTGVCIDENSPSWHVGLKASAIKILARFDRDTAFEAAWAMLRDTNAHDREYYPYIMVNINKQRAIPALLTQLAVENSVLVIWAIGRSLSTTNILVPIDHWLNSSDTSQKLAASRLAGWLKPSAVLETNLKACLNEVDERISQAARESIERISIAREVKVLVEAINYEQDLSRKWILLDCLLAIAEPGDKHTNWPCWAYRLIKTLPSPMQLHFVETIKKRKEELAREGDMKDRRSRQSG